jgi:hypothetical protein
MPGTVSRPLISASAADRPDGHRWQAGIRREVLDRILIVNQAARGCRTTTEIRDVRRCDRLGGLIHEYQQLA